MATLERLRVRVPGHALRTLAVQDLPIAVRPGRGARYRDVQVLAPIHFGARTDAPIPWSVPRPEALAEGTLWLTPRAEIESVREELGSEALVLRAQVDTGVWVERVRAPCRAVTVGHGEGGRPTPNWGRQGGPRWELRYDHVWLASRPDDEGAATLRLSAPDGLPTPLVEVERRGAWVRVAARFGSGAAVRGWIRRHHLTAAGSARDETPPAFARAMPTPRAQLCRRARPGSNEYVGPARVAMGALIRWGAGGEVWATVAEPALFTVSWRPGSDWVRIIHVPGLRDDGPCAEVVQHAWVPRRAVSLQGEGNVSSSLLGIE